MKYSELAEVYEELEKTPSKLKKASVIADFLRRLGPEDARNATMLLTGRVFPSNDPRELGIAGQTAMKIVGRAAGFTPEDVERLFAKEGDLGLLAEEQKKR